MAEIKNIFTTTSATKTIAEIQKRLAKSGAKAILIEYDDDGLETSVSFRMLHKDVMVTFRLPANIDNIYVIVQNHGDRPKFRTREHAGRVAWRIIKDWVDAQCAIVAAEQAEMVQVFLPYAQVPETGKTLYEHLQTSKFKLLGEPQ